MFMYVFSIALIVASNIVYHISQKSTPGKANPFSALLVAYLIASLLTALALVFYRTDEGYIQSFKALNWTSIVLGASSSVLNLGS